MNEVNYNIFLKILGILEGKMKIHKRLRCYRILIWTELNFKQIIQWTVKHSNKSNSTLPIKHLSNLWVHFGYFEWRLNSIIDNCDGNYLEHKRLGKQILQPQSSSKVQNNDANTTKNIWSNNKQKNIPSRGM